MQEGEDVEFEVKEAVPSILYLGRKFSREAINVTGPLVSEFIIYFFYCRYISLRKIEQLFGHLQCKCPNNCKFCILEQLSIRTKLFVVVLCSNCTDIFTPRLNFSMPRSEFGFQFLFLGGSRSIPDPPLSPLKEKSLNLSFKIAKFASKST